MTSFVALLRAVNVSGQNRLPMAELRELLSGIGLRDVQTYVQSGNVLFAAESDDAAAQAAIVHEAIAGEFGHDVTVIALSAAEMAGAASGNPFAATGVDDKTLHVTFLSSPVTATLFDALEPPAQPEELATLATEGSLAGRVVYLHLPHGYGRTKLNNAYFERRLKTPATTRNWRTVLALAGLSER
jgi:uncharacterized protein (DUF1697 family)